jgi:hypothetical protein
MEEELLREIARGYLIPFFSGARLEGDAILSTAREECVAFSDPQSIVFKIDRQDNYRLKMTRPQPFATTAGNIVPEITVVRAFTEIVGTMASALASPLKHDLLSTFERRVVAKSVSSVRASENVLLSGIDQLAQWSCRTYEGSTISAAVGFRDQPQEENAPTLNEIAKHDFSAVISNGIDTIL